MNINIFETSGFESIWMIVITISILIQNIIISFLFLIVIRSNLKIKNYNFLFLNICLITILNHNIFYMINYHIKNISNYDLSILLDLINKNNFFVKWFLVSYFCFFFIIQYCIIRNLNKIKNQQLTRFIFSIFFILMYISIFVILIYFSLDIIFTWKIMKIIFLYYFH